MTDATLVPVAEDRTIPTEHVGKIESNFYCRGWNSKRKKYCGSRAGRGTAHSGSGRCVMHGGEKIGGDARVSHGLKSTQRNKRIRQLIEHHLADPNPLDVTTVLATAKALMDDFIERYYELVPALLAWYASTTPLAEDQRLALLRAIEELEATYAGELTDRQRDDLALARAAVEHLREAPPEKPRRLLDISDAVRHADTISRIVHRVNQHHAQSAVSYARLASFMFELSRELDALVPDREQLRKINDRILTIRI